MTVAVENTFQRSHGIVTADRNILSQIIIHIRIVFTRNITVPPDLRYRLRRISFRNMIGGNISLLYVSVGDIAFVYGDFSRIRRLRSAARDDILNRFAENKSQRDCNYKKQCGDNRRDIVSFSCHLLASSHSPSAGDSSPDGISGSGSGCSGCTLFTMLI